jgi:hypothetical protein
MNETKILILYVVNSFLLLTILTIVIDIRYNIKNKDKNDKMV